jgi:hypothetical protein
LRAFRFADKFLNRHWGCCKGAPNAIVHAPRNFFWGEFFGIIGSHVKSFNGARIQRISTSIKNLAFESKVCYMKETSPVVSGDA